MRKVSRNTEIVDGPGVKAQFAQLFQDERTELICIASPYFTWFGSSQITALWQSLKDDRPKPELKIVVSLCLDYFVRKASNAEAVDAIFQLQQNYPEAKISVRFLDELHAKIYATNWCGIVGSANLTRPGFEGGNVEAAIISKNEHEVRQIQQQFNIIWSQSQVLTKEAWGKNKKIIDLLSKKYESVLEEMKLAIWKARVSLTRIPDGGNDANYYSNLVGCLNAMSQNNRNASCSKSELIALLQSGADNNISPKSIEARIEFIREIGLIKKHNSRFRVTPLGMNLDYDYPSRWKCFKLLMRWCEKNGDSQFRVLLKAIDETLTTPDSKVAIKDLRNAIHPSKRRVYWERPSTISGNDQEACNQFRDNSCHARNWLKSLDVLRHNNGRPIKYYMGDVYKFYLLPKQRKGISMDERLNEIIEGKED